MPYFEVGVYSPKYNQNIGTLWRSAYQLGASGIFTIGCRYRSQPTDTVKSTRHVPLRHFETLDDFAAQRPIGAVLIGVEMGGAPLSQFTHPKQAIYLLGAEDYGLPADVLEYCDRVVTLEAVNFASYNVAVAGSIVLYDRLFGAKPSLMV